MKKLNNVVIIPYYSDKKSAFIYKLDSGKLILNFDSKEFICRCHLLVLSRDEIKTGDWFYLDDAGILCQYISVKPDKNALKVIGSTDSDLNVTIISDNNVNLFIDKYNYNFINVGSYGYLDGKMELFFNF